MPKLDARSAAPLIALIAALTVGGALALQSMGYSPCELCLKERWPYFAGVPVALLTFLAARAQFQRMTALGYGALILIFVASAALGLYHAGVEWSFWRGPAECSGAVAPPAQVGDFLEQLKHVSVVRCDQPALKILGLSLTVWNALISIGLLGLANVGILRVARLTSSPVRRPI